MTSARETHTAGIAPAGSEAEAPPRSELTSARLTLRAFTDADDGSLTAIAGAREIADTTISVPHPFTADHARQWVEANAHGFASGTDYGFALVLRDEPATLVGYAALREIDREHLQAELSFWIGASYQGQGLVTEAARRLIDFAFDDLGLNRVYAFHMARNEASARVLSKLGMQQEGYLRQRVRKWGVLEDVKIWALLRSDMGR